MRVFFNLLAWQCLGYSNWDLSIIYSRIRHAILFGVAGAFTLIILDKNIGAIYKHSTEFFNLTRGVQARTATELMSQ